MRSEKNVIYPLASTSWDQKEIDAMQRVITNGNFTMGPEVSKFEKQFADFFGSKHAVMSNSGSSANLLALSAIRYSKRFRNNDSKSEIIVPAVSWSTTYYPVHQLGYKLKFVDIDLHTLNATSQSIKSAINENTVGIFIVNLLGNPAQLNEISIIAKENNLFLIEDNCESMGARLGKRYAGTYGVIGTFSSFFSHHISTMEGGMSVTDDEELAQLMMSLRAHGWTRELPDTNHVANKTGDKFDDLYRFVVPGYNLRPLELSGAIGQEQLLKLDGFNNQRRLNASKFLSAIKFDKILVQQETDTSTWFGFSMILMGSLAGKRKQFVQWLSMNGIESRPVVTGNFTKNPVMKHLNHAPLNEMQNADIVHENGLFVGNSHEDLSTEISVLQNAVGLFVERES